MTADDLIAQLDTFQAHELRRIEHAARALAEHIEATQQPGYRNDAGVTYRQEYTRCNKAGCKRCTSTEQGHGPYWYAYWREDGKLRKRYIGKQRP